MSRDTLLSRDPEELSRFAHVEPPAELDAWVRAKLLAAVAERAAGASSAAVPARAIRSGPRPGASPTSSRPLPAPVSVPLAERVALAVGAVACGVQASAFVLRLVWSALTLNR